MQRLGTRDDIGAPVGQVGPIGHTLLILDARRMEMILELLYGLGTHVGVRFNPDNMLCLRAPDHG